MIINQVASGGGGGLDTSDATAYPEHILKDYTAYARGEKLIGTYEPPNVYADALAIFPLDGNVDNLLNNDNAITVDGGAAVYIPAGKNGQAFSATTAATLLFSSNLQAAMAGPFTVAYWFKIESTGISPYPMYRRLFSATMNGSYQALPEISYSGRSSTNRLAFASNTGTVTYNDSNWHLGITTREKNLAALYVDNNNEVLSAWNTNQSYAPTSLRFSHNTYTLNGYIDYIAVWARVLSSNERESLWNSGAGLFI